MYIIFDLDDTLLNYMRTVDDFTLCTLRYFQKKGHKLVINTARSFINTEKLMDLIKPDYTILYGGSMIMDKDKNIIYSNPINQEKLNEMIKYIFNRVKAISVETDKEIFSSDKDYYAPYFDFLNQEFPSSAYKLLFCSLDDELLEELKTKFDVNITTYFNLIWHRAMPKDVSKYLGIVKLLELTNGELKDTIAFGDDYGDVEMINNCAVGVLMKNARDEVKKLVKGYICDTNNDYGVARFLLNYFKER